jgi:hypothetical protein
MGSGSLSDIQNTGSAVWTSKLIRIIVAMRLLLERGHHVASHEVTQQTKKKPLHLCKPRITSEHWTYFILCAVFFITTHGSVYPPRTTLPCILEAASSSSSTAVTTSPLNPHAVKCWIAATHEQTGIHGISEALELIHDI